jgi:hypothetical protein
MFGGMGYPILFGIIYIGYFLVSYQSLDLCSSFVHVWAMDMNPLDTALKLMAPGQKLARGVARHLTSLGLVSIEEFVPTRGLRVDVIALTAKGEIWIVECKSSRADFQTDSKWQGYLEWCDRFFWAVDSEFPLELLPDDTGLIIADAYDGEVVRMAPEDRLAAARRRVMVQKFATHAARRLQAFRDPGAGISF